MPRPTSMAAALFDEVRTGHFWNSILHTLQGWGLGLAIAIVAAIPLGIIVGTSPWLYRSLRFVIDFLRPIPSVALLPLFILLFGLNLDLEAYIVALGAFWPLFFQTIYGVQDVDPVARDTAEAYRLNGLFRFFFVSLPGATPYIATGLRISASIALLLAVGTEMVVGLPGLGFDIKFAATGRGHTPRVRVDRDERARRHCHRARVRRAREEDASLASVATQGAGRRDAASPSSRARGLASRHGGRGVVVPQRRKQLAVLSTSPPDRRGVPRELDVREGADRSGAKSLALRCRARDRDRRGRRARALSRALDAGAPCSVAGDRLSPSDPSTGSDLDLHPPCRLRRVDEDLVDRVRRDVPGAAEHDRRRPRG